MGFLAVLVGLFPLGLGLGFAGVCFGVALGRGLKGLLGGPFLMIRLRVVDGASIFSYTKGFTEITHFSTGV